MTDHRSLWETQANINDLVRKQFDELAKQVRLLTIGLVATTLGLALLTIALIVK